jgi:hypothetical protein
MNSLPTTTGNQNAVPTATQIANYLAANGGVANPYALYVISSGGNDALKAGATLASVTTAANDLVAAVNGLHNAGARYIIVPNLFASADVLTAGQKALLGGYNSSLWSGLAGAGINFIPADINSVLLAVRGQCCVRLYRHRRRLHEAAWHRLGLGAALLHDIDGFVAGIARRCANASSGGQSASVVGGATHRRRLRIQSAGRAEYDLNDGRGAAQDTVERHRRDRRPDFDLATAARTLNHKRLDQRRSCEPQDRQRERLSE